MADDTIWRRYVNSLPELDEDGDDAPQMEKMAKKKKTARRKFFVQKIITEVIVYTDIEGQGFAEATNQKLVLLGEMSQGQLNKLLAAQGHESMDDVDTE